MEYAGVTVPDDDRQAVGGWGDIRPNVQRAVEVHDGGAARRTR